MYYFISTLSPAQFMVKAHGGLKLHTKQQKSLFCFTSPLSSDPKLHMWEGDLSKLLLLSKQLAFNYISPTVLKYEIKVSVSYNTYIYENVRMNPIITYN